MMHVGSGHWWSTGLDLVILITSPKCFEKASQKDHTWQRMVHNGRLYNNLINYTRPQSILAPEEFVLRIQC